MKSSMKLKVFRLFICISSLLLVFILKLYLPFSPFKSTHQLNINGNITRDFLEGDQLICERVDKAVMENRKKGFTSRIRPTHNLIEEFLEIISENKTICQGINTVNTSNEKLLVIIVNSKMDHFRERQVIRDSYGLIREYTSGNVKWHVRTAFLVAQSSNCVSRLKNQTTWMDTKLKENQIETEQKNYGDLVIGSFMDTYRNNTYKHLMGYKFILERCPQADLIVKTDDDVFVNVPEIVNKRVNELKVNKTVNDMYCQVFSFSPDRQKTFRYYVTEEEWSVDQYPKFCAGAFFVLTFDWMRMLYSVRNLGGFFWIDDTHVSGKLRKIAEKEFGVKTKFLNIGKRIWWEGLQISNICDGISTKSVLKKRKQLPMFAQLVRDPGMRNNMKCLTDISLGNSENLKF